MNAMRVGKGNGDTCNVGEVPERDMLACFHVVKLNGSERYEGLLMEREARPLWLSMQRFLEESSRQQDQEKHAVESGESEV
jgi:hypothetical protein